MRKTRIGTPVKPSFWDQEALGYSLMTLMEVNGTNLQLDAMPITSDMVVLDCGCGPGRIAIQAAKRVKEVICLDASEAMLEQCQRNCESAGITNVEYVYADWQEAEIGRTVPEVDMIIQARGGGGPTTLAMLQKAARQYAVTVMWSDGAPCLPESRGKLFTGCYSKEAMDAHPVLRPFKRPDGPRPHLEPGKLPMSGPELKKVLAQQGIEVHVTRVDEGWDKLFASKEEAYTDLINLSRYPELVNIDRFRANVDAHLTQTEEGWQFFLPTSSDVAWFKTR
ncbi:MAG: methyltransferase domain-containing protein [Oscillospiraceae bacterium]|nr:methyltransferase domain-containing protein [Oscillospiraceae bacterium]